MGTKEQTEPDMDDLGQSLGKLRQAGQEPDRKLLNRVKAHGQSAVRPLIAMATDEKLLGAESDASEGWAPLHAVRLLGELGAPEAVEPLLPLFDRVDEDFLAETLTIAFGGIGAPGVAPLRALLFDRSRDVWARVRAAEALGKIGQRHPELRSEVVSALVARLDPAESQAPEDEMLNGSVISELLDLKAVEAETAIRQAFEEDRVDTSVVDLDSTLESLDLAPESRPARSSTRDGLRLRLLCTACEYEREHHVKTIYYDIATHERREKGETTPYSEFIIPQRITCPKCGAVNQYKLSNMAYIILMTEFTKKTVTHKQGAPGAEAEEGPLRIIEASLTDGRKMHPYEARDMYQQQVEAEPNRPDLHVRYASVLRFLGYREEATEQYRTALRLEPANLEAFLNLGQLAREDGDPVEARRMLESVILQSQNSGLSREDRENYMMMAAEELGELAGPPELSVGAQALARLRQLETTEAQGAGAARPSPSAQAVRKVGRNDPCPCGSGKKYKKCHGR